MNTRGSEKPLAIVLGRNFASRLGMTRAAGMAGCDVAVVRTQLNWMADDKADTYSRYVVESRVANEPDSKSLVDTILGFRNNNRKTILLPTDDWTAAVVDNHLDLFDSPFITPHVHHQQGAMVELMNKDKQKTLAREVGANVAEGWVCRSTEIGHTIPEGISFPCFTKPLESHTGALKPYLKRCDNLQQLEDVLATISKKCRKDILVEEFRTINKEYAVLGVAFEGKAIMPAFIEMDKSREGVTATGWVCPIKQLGTACEVLKNFMAKTKFTGLFDIDLYESGDKIFFNELNTRFGASGYAVTKAACNLPGIVIQHGLGLPQENIVEDFVPQTFANEKVCFDMLHTGMISYFQYKKIIKNADILFIDESDDPNPMLYLKKKYHPLFLRYMAWILKRNIKNGKRK